MAMSGENRPLVADEPVEYENTRLKLKTSGKPPITLENIPHIHEDNGKM